MGRVRPHRGMTEVGVLLVVTFYVISVGDIPLTSMPQRSFNVRGSKKSTVLSYLPVFRFSSSVSYLFLRWFSRDLAIHVVTST